MSFENLLLAEPIQRALVEENYGVPTPIQRDSIPIILDGFDLIGCAQTGSGKTAAFALPVLHHISKNPKKNGIEGMSHCGAYSYPRTGKSGRKKF